MRISLTILASCAALVGGCKGPTGPEFGELYSLALEPRPSIDGASLTVTLSYRGCNAGDTFIVEHRVRGGTAEVWLRKRDLEQCGAFFRESRTFTVPAAVRDAAPLYLLSPNQNPFLLRP